MISHRRFAGDQFERRLHATGLNRLRIRWRHWAAAKGNPNGEIVSSPRWPLPFGPPIVRAVGTGGEVVIKPWDERDRPRWMTSLSTHPSWAGNIQVDAYGNGCWLRVPDDRVTDGCYVVFEHIDGKDNPVYMLSAIDGGPVELSDKTIEVIKSSQGAADDFQRAQEARIKEATIRAGFDRSGVAEKVIRRTPAQQEWRAGAEDKVAELEAYRYHRRFGVYQHDPPLKDGDDGVVHPAGFVVRDRRTVKQDGLAETP